MNTLRLFFSSKVNLLTLIILLVVTLTSFAHERDGGTEISSASEVNELAAQLKEHYSIDSKEVKHIYRFVDVQGNVISEISSVESEALNQKSLQKMILKSDRLFSSQGTTYYLVN
jgi:hypothetical protein